MKEVLKRLLEGAVVVLRVYVHGRHVEFLLTNVHISIDYEL